MDSAPPLPDESTLAWAESILGAVTVVGHFSHLHAYSRLWRLESNGRFYWLKMHAYARKWAGEVCALSRWTPALGQAPLLVGVRTDPRAVLLTEVGGTPAEEIDLSEPAERRLWTEAGAWLAQLHRQTNDWLGEVNSDGTPLGTTAVDPVAFLTETWERKREEGRRSGLFLPGEVDFVDGVAREGLPTFAHESARALHRDFTPRNWMADPDGRFVAVIDFEHARWDVRAADLERPWNREFLARPGLIDAFYEGYGGLGDRLNRQIQTLRTLHAFNTVTWATKVGDLEFAAEGRRALEILMAKKRG